MMGGGGGKGTTEERTTWATGADCDEGSGEKIGNKKRIEINWRSMLLCACNEYRWLVTCCVSSCHSLQRKADDLEVVSMAGRCGISGVGQILCTSEVAYSHGNSRELGVAPVTPIGPSGCEERSVVFKFHKMSQSRRHSANVWGVGDPDPTSSVL